MTTETKKKPQHGSVIHAEQCKGCGRCVISCPQGNLEMTSAFNSHGYKVAGVVGDGTACTACGICFYMCPEPGAISVRRKPKKPGG